MYSKLYIYLSQGGESLENKIKELRKEGGVTQEELAKAVAVTRQTIISLESGKYNPSLRLAFDLAKFFKCSIEDIFICDDEQEE